MDKIHWGAFWKGYWEGWGIAGPYAIVALVALAVYWWLR
jgi:hypothetical protein